MLSPSRQCGATHLPRRTPDLTGWLHIRIVRSVPALRCDPVDILARILDVAGLAMHAVLEVDHETRLLALFVHHLVDARRAITLCGLCVFRQVDADRHVGIPE